MWCDQSVTDKNMIYGNTHNKRRGSDLLELYFGSGRVENLPVERVIRGAYEPPIAADLTIETSDISERLTQLLMSREILRPSTCGTRGLRCVGSHGDGSRQLACGCCDHSELIKYGARMLEPAIKPAAHG